MENIETSGFETHLLECYLFMGDYLQSNPKVAGSEGGWLAPVDGQ